MQHSSLAIRRCFADYRALASDKIDLGETWTTWTGRPFVWAFWAGRADAADRLVVERLEQARNAGVAASTRLRMRL
jgi:predicted solute-binding protein